MTLGVFIQIKHPYESATLSFLPLRGNGGGRNRSPNGLNNGRHYPYESGGRHGGHYGVQGRGDGGPPHNPYGAGSDSSFSSWFRRRCRHHQCTQKHDQFEQSMIAMNNSLTYFLHFQ